jgi:hypothetical protein
MSIDRANGIWVRNVPAGWERDEIAITDIPTTLLGGKLKDIRWAVYHLSQSNRYVVIPTTDLKRALRGASVRDNGRK